MEEHREDIDAALARCRSLSQRGEYKAAVAELEGVREWMAFNTKEGCELILELAMAYETADMKPAAAELYGNLQKCVFPEVRTNARILLGRLYAVEELGMGESGKEMAKVAQFSLNQTALAQAAALAGKGKAMVFVQSMQSDVATKEPEAAADVALAASILYRACVKGVDKPSAAAMSRRRAATGTSRDPELVSPEEALSAVWRLQIEAEKAWVREDDDDDVLGNAARRPVELDARELELRLDGAWTPRLRIRLGESVPFMAVLRVPVEEQPAAKLIFDAGTRSLEGTVSAGPFKAASQGTYSCDTSLGRNILKLDLPGKMLLPGSEQRLRVLHVSSELGVMAVATGSAEVEIWYREATGLEGDLLRLSLEKRDEAEVQRWLYAWAETSFANPSATAAARSSLTSKVKVLAAAGGVRILFQASRYNTEEDGDEDGESGGDPDAEGGLQLTYDGAEVRVARCNYGPGAIVKEMSEEAIVSALKADLFDRFPQQ
mmetsp:Transcript_35474/g.111655  ORF Transcript_35474/g.111655 Transcript_35474/m.111655 type:complete len:492 (+) Transcript_35474:968-2443(+)